MIAETSQFSPPQRKPRLIKLAEVKDRCALGKTAIYARIKNGTFPRPIVCLALALVALGLHLAFG